MELFLAREILSITGITIRETGTEGKGARFEMEVPKGAFRSRRGRKIPEPGDVEGTLPPVIPAAGLPAGVMPAR